MDEYFIDQLNISLNELRDRDILTYENLEEHLKQVGSGSGSNSPATLSDSSGGGSDRFRKLTYTEVVRSFDQYDSSKYYSELSILLTYFNGQKNLYDYSKNVAFYKLNLLMIPTIVLSASSTIMVPFISEFEWSAAVISGIYGMITFLLTLVHYYKLESSYQQFSSLTDKYNKLHSSLELTNNKLAFIESESEQSKVIANNIRLFEDKLSDINNVLIPEDVKLLFPVICHINMFSFIQKIEGQKRALIIKYKDIKNEIRYIYFKRGDIDRKHRLTFLLDAKDKLRDEIIQYKEVYNCIDVEFTREIQNAERNKKRWFWILLFGMSYKGNNENLIVNPIIRKHMIGI